MRLPILLAVALAPTLLAETPKAVPPGCTVELVASDPDIRTPTAIAVDARGRVWVLENNTHFRPKNYDGPPTDRVLILDDFGPDGRARKITTYADGFSDGMGLLVLPGGDAILSTRAATLRLHDADGDGRADSRRTLLTLVTDDKYPHNGLSGITRAPDGTLFLGLGENHGFPWTLTGTDGAVVRGSDEGAIFRFDDEGRGLVHWALGIWNPFGLACDPAGRLFALDNDPGGGSFCRLLHIVKSGDYGYRYRYGRTIDHPFISWDGRWPGTLPPMCYVGEAPTGLLWHGGALLGCTWTDHAVQRFPLEARGASFTTKPEVLLSGGYDFRPSGIAAAPDGTLYISDWVDGSYDVHGKGRIWRVRGVKATPDAVPVSDGEKMLASLVDEKRRPFISLQGLEHMTIAEIAKATSTDVATLNRLTKDFDLEHNSLVHGLIGSVDPFIHRAAVLEIAKDDKLVAMHASDPDGYIRESVLLAQRLRKSPFPTEALKDYNPGVRRAALEWIGVERLTAFAGRIDDALDGNPNRMVFHAYLAAGELLASEKIDPNGKASTAARFQRVADIALDPKRKPELRALALRLLPVQHPALTLEVLRTLIAEPTLSAEAAHILASRSDEPAQAEMRKLVNDPATNVRAEALAGLFHSATSPETRDLLEKAAASDNPAVRREASRSLGKPLVIADAPLEIDPASGYRLGPGPDPAAGRRLFFHPRGPQCANCHQIEGRGRAIGPDLTGVWRMSAEQLLEAIREPSKAIAPAFVQWHVKMKDGTEALGIDQFMDNKSDYALLDATGKLTRFRFADTIEREPLPISLMPPALIDALTEQERADLIAYLREPRE